MISLPTALQTTVDSIGAGKPYAWLFAIAADHDYETESGTAFYTTTYDQNLTYDNLFDLPVATRTYAPMGMRVGQVVADTTASTPALTVSVSNVFHEVSFRMDTGRGFLGCEARYVVVNVDHLADGAIMAGEGIIRSAVMNGTSATFAIEIYGLSSLSVPQSIFVVDRCRYRYGDENCGFPLDLVTGAHPIAFKKCNKTFSDCKARGVFEGGTLNRPIKHPMRFGGFLGLPRLMRR